MTCVGQSDSCATTVTLASTGANTFVIPVSGGLNSGIWMHHISIGDQLQHRRAPVLYTSDSAQYATVRWTYHPTVIQVNKAGDATGSCTGGTCTFRQAVDAANAVLFSTPAILIQLMLSPGLMTQTSTITIGNAAVSPIITIDGTDAVGNPWIVGDALAAAQGKQSPFLRTIDVRDVTRIQINGDKVTFRGIAVVNTAAPQNDTLIASAGDDTLIEAVRVDGGATGTCGSCVELGANLISIGGSNVQIVNVEGRGAFSNGVRVSIVGFQEIRDSWFHHNWGSAILADGVTLRRNVLELSGRRLSDNAVVTADAVGIRGSGGHSIQSVGNIIRNNTKHGIDILLTSGLAFEDDYVCGNDEDGILVSGNHSSNFAVGVGLGAVYNGQIGVRFTDNFNDDTVIFQNSAFTANAICGMDNSSTTEVSATNNQWRGVTDPMTEVCTDSPDFCSGGGPIDCVPIQNYVDAAVLINATEPTYPRNAFIGGQTVRVQGGGFNAIQGNPEAGTGTGQVDCAIGDDDVSNQNCCRMKTKANVCGSTGTPPLPPSDGSQCVAILDATAQWKRLSVTSVTPTTIVTEVPDPALLCIGAGYTQTVRVVKQGSSGPIALERPYCVSTP